MTKSRTKLKDVIEKKSLVSLSPERLSVLNTYLYNVKLHILDAIRKDPEQNAEFEMRYGLYDEQFTPGISDKKTFLSLVDKFSEGEKSVCSMYILAIDNTLRTILEFDLHGRISSTKVMYKTRVSNFDVQEFNVRLSYSLEKYIQKIPSDRTYSTFRIIQRKTIIQNGMKHDFSVVWQTDATRQELAKLIDSREIKYMKMFVKNAEFYVPDDIKIGTIRFEYEVEIPINILDKFQNFVDLLYDTISRILIITNRELIDKSRIESILSLISAVANSYRHYVIAKSASRGLDKLLSRARTIQVLDMPFVASQPYSVTLKADGISTAIFINDGTIYIANQTSVITKTHQKFSDFFKKYNNTLIHVEQIELVETTSYIVIDALMCAGKSIYNNTQEERLNAIQTVLSEGLAKIIPISMKEFKFSSENASIFGNALQLCRTKVTFPTDGLILTPSKENYYSNNIFKWKPPEKNSIDFLLRFVERTDNNKSKYYLFVTISEVTIKKYGINIPQWYSKYFDITTYKSGSKFPFPFITETFQNSYIAILPEQDLDYTICELIFVKNRQQEQLGRHTGKWKFFKVREDKTAQLKRGEPQFGNGFITAQNIWYSIFIAEVTKEMITTGRKIPSGFFSKELSISERMTDPSYNYKEMNRLVKEFTYTRYINGCKYMLDIGAGRLNDYNRYVRSGLQLVVANEADPLAILQFLLHRKSNITSHIASLSIVLGDFKHLNAKDFTERIDNSKFDVIISSWSIHFLFSTKDDIINTLEKIDSMLEHGGKFVIIYMDGKSVFDLLHEFDYGDVIQFRNINKVIIFEIKKNYKDGKFKKYSQTIETKIHAFTDKFVEEQLVNMDYILSLLSRVNSGHSSYRRITDKTFPQIIQPMISRVTLSADEQKLENLFRLMVLVKE